MLSKIFIGLAGVVVVLAIVVATRPAQFRVERSTTIAASPERPFARVNDFHEWAAWSPYEKKDPQMRRTFAGAPAGAGAVYAWSGNSEVGEGRMTIVRSEAPSEIAIQLEFTKPFTATNTATFTFTPVPQGTKVTWAMEGNNNFVGKAVSLVMDLDQMVGSDFARGLASLKALAESAAMANVAGTR